MKIHPTTEIEKWRSVFQNYGAVLDLPAILFYKELMAVFPNAKVILTLREPKSWYKSWHNSIALQLEELKKNKIDRICRAVRLNRLVTLIYISISILTLFPISGNGNVVSARLQIRYHFRKVKLALARFWLIPSRFEHKRICWRILNSCLDRCSKTKPGLCGTDF